MIQHGMRVIVQIGRNTNARLKYVRYLKASRGVSPVFAAVLSEARFSVDDDHNKGNVTWVP